ncbi:MAG: hypothetical protein A3K53_05655 [Deltaproteobacteria bacterium RIFOXYB2_FULL_66_7]|nr:MAG: hypothetical protein A3K53_05655 [Deltaproteobacteria bacterium RIFOXYB2_FULL_66_7]
MRPHVLWRLRLVLPLTVAFFASVFLVVATLEGLFRVVPFCWSAARLAWRTAHEGRSYLRSDPLLGWANAPDVFIPDFFGPSQHLRTDARGFRGAEQVSPRPARRRLKLACSGDSLTFGAGVGDEQTWCRRLGLQDPRLETINLGVPLYGLDQSYLRYARDAAPLAPDIHIAAVGDVDAQISALSGSLLLPRPALELEDGRLGEARPPKWGIGPVRCMVPLLRTMDSHLGVFSALGRLVSSRRSRRRAEALLLSILGSFDAQARARGGAFLAVFLPTTTALERDWEAPEADRLCAELRRRGIPVVNLVDEFRRWPDNVQHQIFQPMGLDLSLMGHERIAVLLYRRLLVAPGAAQLRSRGVPR